MTMINVQYSHSPPHMQIPMMVTSFAVPLSIDVCVGAGCSIRIGALSVPSYPAVPAQRPQRGQPAAQENGYGISPSEQSRNCTPIVQKSLFPNMAPASIREAIVLAHAVSRSLAGITVKAGWFFIDLEPWRCPPRGRYCISSVPAVQRHSQSR